MILNKIISLAGRSPYFSTLNGVLDFSILPGSKVLLVDSSEQARQLSQRNLKHSFELTHVLVSDLESFQAAPAAFDFIVLNNCINYLEDVQVTLDQLHRWSSANTRILLTHSSLFSAAFVEAHSEANNLSLSDVSNMLYLADFEKVRVEKRLLFPFYIPGLSFLLNKYVSQLPIFNRFCSLNFIIARPLFNQAKELTVSVIVPARNEKGNIQNIVDTVPELGAGTELIFIEGHSSDDTFAEIQRVVAASGKLNIKVAQQTGKGKGDAVRLGFEMATGDILMILDADLTVPPDDLHKFYNAIASGKGEYINGSRMIYPQEKEAMRLLNLWGNRFFAWAFTWLLGQRITDTLCGTKVLSKQSWNKIIQGRSYFGDFDPFGDFDLILGATRQNLKFVEIPVRYKARVYGSTNISRFRHGFLLLRMVIFSLGKIKFR